MPIDRRSVLTSTAALPALAVPAAAIPTDHPDAELLMLGREFDRLALLIGDCFRRMDVAHKQAEAMTIDMPDCLRPKVGDRRAGLPAPVCELYDCVDMRDIRKIDHPRAREIVRAYEAWEASRKEAFERSGYIALERERDLLADQIDPIEDRICEMPAYTLEGMKVKARVALYANVGAFAGNSDRATVSIAVDLLRMQGVQPAASDHEYVARGGYRQFFQQSA